MRNRGLSIVRQKGFLMSCSCLNGGLSWPSFLAASCVTTSVTIPLDKESATEISKS